MYKHILAQHNSWRLWEMLKSYLKPWKVSCIKRAEMLSPCTLCALTLNFWLQRETHEVPNWQFLYRFPWRKSSHELFFFFGVAVSCQTLVLFGEIFFTSRPNGAEIEKQMHWQILALLSTTIYLCRYKLLSTRNAREQILCHVYRYLWHTRKSWTPVAPLGTAGCWAALQSAVDPSGCQQGGCHPSLKTTVLWTSPSPWFRELMQYIVLLQTLGGMYWTPKLHPGNSSGAAFRCRDTHSRSFWTSKWCLNLAKSTLSQWINKHGLK